MGERVSSLGGELRAGPRPEGGFEVRARIPIQGATMPEDPAAHADEAHSPTAGQGSRWQWQDLVFAGVLLAVLEVAIFTGSDVRGPLALNALVIDLVKSSSTPTPPIEGVGRMALPLVSL